MTAGMANPGSRHTNGWRGDHLRDRASEWTWELRDLEGQGLTELGRELTHGFGFALVRGLPLDELGDDLAAARFLEMGSALGSIRSQNASGDLLGHVRDTGVESTDPTVRIYQTAERQTFHTDSCDVVGLLCLRSAPSGGESLLVSASTIHAEMVRREPDLAAALFEPIATDRRGEVPPGADPFFLIPVFSWYDEALTVMYQRQYIESAQRFPDAPRLTGRTVAALDLFDEIANDPDIHLAMRLEPGDIQFVHNHSLLHDRTGFQDDPENPRHLLRLWLSVEGDRALPPVFASRFGSTTVGDRGGITAERS
ncbi:MAG: TauD/TfdA family dioxygenase [Acidimicrobiales bacterium]